jgi:hypothetical protein
VAAVGFAPQIANILIDAGEVLVDTREPLPHSRCEIVKSLAGPGLALHSLQDKAGSPETLRPDRDTAPAVKPGSHEYFRWFYGEIHSAEGIPERWTEDAVVHQSPDMPGTAQVFEGHEGVMAVGRELTESYSEIEWDPREVRELGDARYLVLIWATGRGRGSGIVLEGEIGHVVTLEGDRVGAMDVYLSWDAARDAAGVEI